MNSITAINSLPSQLITDEVLSRCDALTLTAVCCVNKEYEKLASHSSLWKRLFPDVAMPIEEGRFFNNKLPLSSGQRFGLALTTKKEESFKNEVLQYKNLYGRIKKFLDKFELGDSGKLTVSFPGQDNTKIVVKVKFPPAPDYSMAYDRTTKVIEESSECLVNGGLFITNDSKEYSHNLWNLNDKDYYELELRMWVTHQNINLDCKKVQSIALERLKTIEPIITKILRNENCQCMFYGGLMFGPPLIFCLPLLLLEGVGLTELHLRLNNHS